MKLVCVHPFGHFKPGAEVEVPDGAVFDRAYFAVQAEPKKEKAPAKEESK